MKLMHLLRITRNAFNRRRALATLIRINVAVSCALWFSVVILPMFGLSQETLFSLLALPSDPVVVFTRPWSPVTYMFLQFSPFHLLFNLLTLFFFGAVIYDCEGSRRLILLYILCGLTAATVFIIFCSVALYEGSPKQMPLAGASGAIIGIMTYAATIQPQRTFFLLGAFRIRLWQITLTLLALSFISGFGSNTGGIAVHCGGLIAGLIIGLMTTRYAHVHGKRFRKIHLRPAVNPKERLGEILEKISVSGFESLSEIEKNDLRFITDRLKIKIDK